MNELLMQNAWRAFQAGNLAEAARLCQETLRDNPKDFNALYLLGYANWQFGRLSEAERLIGEALRVNPRSPDALYNRGCILMNMARHEEALGHFQKALALKPDFLEATINCGVEELELRHFDKALAHFERALALKPDDAQSWNNRGNALLELKREAEALASFEKSVALNPNNASTWSNRGIALQRLKRYEDALISLDRALAIDPKLATVYNNRGNALMAMRRFEEGFLQFERALAVGRDAGTQGAGANALLAGPGILEALINRGTALVALKRVTESLASYDQALALKPDSMEALRNRANAFVILKRFEEAAKDCEAILNIEPGYMNMPGILAHCRLQCCDWRNLERDRAAIAEGMRAGRHVTPPFEFAALCRSAEDQFACARIFAADRPAPAPSPLWQDERYGHKKIRLAYISADFRNHAVASLISGVFEHHARDRFETIAVSFGTDRKSAGRSRIEAAFDRFLDVDRKDDSGIAQQLRQMEIDIAVDLMGYTGECRPGILEFRPAPIQVNYLGFPGTLGVNYMDYLIADRVVIPDEARRFYSERIVHLPDTYMPNDSARPIAEHAPTRAQAGLPQDGFVFCSFNNAYKFSPEIFDIWMRLLHAVENSVLWLPQGNEAAARNLKREAEARGIGADRLRFAPFLPNGDEHLARLRLADLFLDTLPFNAHSTAADALWAGLPLLTSTGGSFAGRVATSLLQAVGLPEMATQSLEAYEALALKLAREPAFLAAIREKLARNRRTHPLFDTKRYTRHLEAAYSEMWERHQRGEAPASFAVDRLPTPGAP
jgi:predicted O-linked N-acetylglucosamine transferase (SPINDLY family)